MVLLAILLAVLAGLVGAGVLVVLWPMAVLAWVGLYIVDRPVRRTAWPIVVGALVVADAVFRVADWHPHPNAGTKLIILAAPLALGYLLVLACGGRKRIKARHERADDRRRLLRAEQRKQKLENRKAAVRRKTGVDVDLVAGATARTAGRMTRAVGTRVTNRLERRRGKESTDGPPQWLDLDRDVAADISQQQREEIVDLADQLDRTRRPRPN